MADGIRLPLTALAQKVWDPAKPTLTWDQFQVPGGEGALSARR
ncbi:hypothetical protein STANM309S_05028 [Streptomyces tanashiensis]